MRLWLFKVNVLPLVPIWPPVMITDPGPVNVVAPVSTNSVVPLSARVPPVVVPRFKVPMICVTAPVPEVYVLPSLIVIAPCVDASRVALLDVCITPPFRVFSVPP